MKIKVSAGFSGKIPTGSFQNMSPSFSAEVEYEIPSDGATLPLEIINADQKLLHRIAYENFKIVAEVAKVEKIKNDLKGFRFYKTERGEYPSVTTIIDPEYRPFVGEDELAVAIAEGNICHARAAHFIKTGQWVDPKTLEGVTPDRMLLKGKFIDNWDFPAFLKKYPLENMQNGRTLVNHEHRYAGTHDMDCLITDKNGTHVVIADFKRTPDKHKNFTQMAAYAKCEGMEKIGMMMIIPTNPDNTQGFSKPIVSTDIDKYFELFLDKRAIFKEMYGI